MNILVITFLLVFTAAAIEVFIVPHSHNDVGWLITEDQYYEQRTRLILNNLYDVLLSDPQIKFSWAESAYLSTWIKEFPEKKATFKRFLDDGRVEIIGGGWTQNDEATPDFELVIRQMEDGYNFLKSEFNITKIKTGWQIDPFGHSSLTTALWEKMGYESLTVSRVPDPLYKSGMRENKTLEFIWKGIGFGAKDGLLMHVLNGTYYLPGFLDIDEPYPESRCFSIPLTLKDLESW